MKVLRDLDIFGTAYGDILTSDVPETVAEYNPATSYSEGQLARDEAAHRLYESLVNSNTGNPLTDPTKWLDIGPTNRWAMFDDRSGTKTVQADSIEVELAIPGRVDSISMLGLRAGTARLVINDGSSDVFDEIYNLVSNDNVNDIHDYFFEEVIATDRLVVENLPFVFGPTITITITNEGSDAECGVCQLGSMKEFGGTLYGATIGQIDYSIKEFDDFGEPYLIERPYSDTGSFQVIIEKGMVDETRRVLTERRAKPTIFVATSEYSSTTIFGFVREWRTVIEYPLHSILSIEIEGLT